MKTTLKGDKKKIFSLLEKADAERVLFESDDYLCAYNEGRVAGICEVLDNLEEVDNEV